MSATPSASATSLAPGAPLFPQAPGMVSYTYRNEFQKDVSGTLDLIRGLGITDMEFSNLFGLTAPVLRALLDERGMVCSSYGVQYPDLVEKTAQVGETANILGAKFVRVAWFAHEAPFSLEQARRVVADFNRAGKILREEHGIDYCFHNHGFEFQPHGDGTLFDYIVRETDPRYVSFELDILWAFFPGHDPAALLLKYPDRFRLMHLKDLRKGVPGDLTGQTPTENDVALGTGQLDLPAILKAARRTRIEHYYIEDESPSIAVQVPQSIAYLKALSE
ncbi:MAG: sugar phosphate isomerase/epimerase [Burkholderiales bacterium]|nr:sugar phosphate isomerase/epimerase [Opitutaceae bacterium]